MCAGIIAAGVNNESAGRSHAELHGPAGEGAGQQGQRPVSNIAAGIVYAVDHGADIINLSLGCPDASQTLQEAVDYAWGKGVAVIAATGNTGLAIQYPAACSHAVAVGAVTSSHDIASYSNHGSQQALVAVGSTVFTTSLKGGYAVGSGTSFAAPFVSSLAALLLSVSPAHAGRAGGVHGADGARSRRSRLGSVLRPRLHQLRRRPRELAPDAAQIDENQPEVREVALTS
jgi:subtilisin family serine protease